MFLLLIKFHKLRWIVFISLFQIFPFTVRSQSTIKQISAEVFGDSFDFSIDSTQFTDTLSENTEEAILKCILDPNKQVLTKLGQELKNIQEKYNYDDWIYYQLIRKIAEQLSPKSKNYILYTIYKWYLMSCSGYNAQLAYSKGKVLFFIKCSDNIYNIPIRLENGQQYVCLNYHDYENSNFQIERFRFITLGIFTNDKSFTYNVKTLPDKDPNTREKWLKFDYNGIEYSFKIKFDPNITTYFKNYPSLDYEKQFNIPLSHETYKSLIPTLKTYLKRMKIKSGVDFLMHFTRNAFLFKPDVEIYGKEKRFSPEMTLLSESSDCEDRVSLLYYLIKEIYDLPMIILVYPQHVTLAVHFEKNIGHLINYSGKYFTICEPTPQSVDLKMGEILPSLKHVSFDVAFYYNPSQKNLP